MKKILLLFGVVMFVGTASAATSVTVNNNIEITVKKDDDKK